MKKEVYSIFLVIVIYLINGVISQNNLYQGPSDTSDFSATLVADTTAPFVNLTSPDDLVSFTSNSISIEFNYNVTDDNNIANCSFIVDSLVHATNNSINKSVINSFTEIFGPGSYNWNVNCTDINNNVGNSSIRSFTVSAPVSVLEGGGGGGFSGSGGKVNYLVIYKTILYLSTLINTTNTSEIELYNNGISSLKVDISVIGLDGIIEFEEEDLNFNLRGLERRTIKFNVKGPLKSGIYTGKILVNNREILVSVKVGGGIFDVNFNILNKFKILSIGDKLISQVILVPIGDEPVDVVINYIIKNFDGETFLVESDTFLVEGKKIFEKRFGTEHLNSGNYILALELFYPGGVAVSSDNFEIKEKKSPFYIIIILLILGLIIWIIFNRNRKDEKKERNINDKKFNKFIIKWRD